MNRWCGILPSPDILDIPSCPGQDETGTQKDLLHIWNLVDKKGFQQWSPQDKSNIINLLSKGRTIEMQQFGPFVNSAYKCAFDPLRNTNRIDQEEIIFLYYAGHGLSKDNVDNDLTENERRQPPVPDMPHLEDDYFAAADKFLPMGQLKGGELYLHHRGFCDLRGLLRPFIAALETPSSNVQTGGEQEKTNKHLVIVVDSCYSGVFADDLKELKDKGKLNRWLQRGCSFTVQASCKSDESTFGGYFTPCFVRLNNDRETLKKLFALWQLKSPGEKQKSIEEFADDLPSPTVYTTKSSENNRFPITLFNDSEFFKFCFIELYGHDISEPRKLDATQRKNFLSQQSFDIIDFKLKTFQEEGIYEGTPMGLFLVRNPNYSNDKRVCVHVHYEMDNPNIPTTFKLFEHDFTKSLNKQKKWGSKLYNANQASHPLTEACKLFVRATATLPENTEFEDWWTNLANWNMKGKCGTFRNTLRTLWMKNALQKRRLTRVARFDETIVYRKDLETLNEGGWVCDTIINVLLRYYCKLAEKYGGGNQLFFPLASDFQQKLLIKGPMKDRPLDLSGYNIAEDKVLTPGPPNMCQYKYVLVPISDMVHWWLVAYEIETGYLYVLCSLGQQKKIVALNMKRYFEDVRRDQKWPENITPISEPIYAKVR